MLVKLAVDISRDLELLGRLKRYLVAMGVRAEVRDHLMGLIVYPVAGGLPVCVFVSGAGQFYSWDGGQRRKPVIEAAQVAAELAAIVAHDAHADASSVGERRE